MTTSTLDIERFRKVETLIARGATAGERASARSRAEAMAKAAGLTFKQASAKAKSASTAKAPPPQQQAWTDAFRDMFNDPEIRAARSERERKRQERVRELLRQYGSEEAVMRPCDREQALEAACQPYVVARETTGWSIGSLSGWDGGRAMPAHIRKVVTEAVPLPTAVTGIWAEFQYWERRTDDRYTIVPDGDPPIWVRARTMILERKLDAMHANDFPDILARISWMEFLNGRGFTRDVLEDEILVATLRADIEMMAEQADLRSPDPGSANLDPADAQSQQQASRSSVSGTGSVQSRQADFSDKLSGKSPGEVLREDRKIPAPDVSAKTGENPASVQIGQGADKPNRDHLRTASDRRRAVLAMIRDPASAGLSDREIARRIGVSPQTVSTWRRKAKETST